MGESLQAEFATGAIARDDVFTTTKLWNTNHRPERVEPAFDASRERLGISYADLYLIHTPFAFQPGDNMPQTELLEFCKQKRIALLAFAPLGHGVRPGPLEDPAVLAIARQSSLTPTQVLLAWAIQRGTAVLTTAKTLERARENYNISEIPEVAVDEINRIQTRSRLNSVVETGVPGYIAKGG